MEYKDTEPDVDKEYNMAMIGAVFSAVRLFSVERDRMGEKWRSVEYIKQSRERLLELFQNISPFSKGNYWSKILVLLTAGGLSISNIIVQGYQNTEYFIYYLIILLLVFELVSKLGEYKFSKWIGEKVPSEKSEKWINESISEYKAILEHFIDEAVDINLRYYPDEKKLYGYDLTDQSSINALKEDL